MPDVIILNGGSSSGKSSLARELQRLLEEPWITLGVDDLLAALAPSLVGDAPAHPGHPTLLSYGADGSVHVSPRWGPVESAWYCGIAAMARAGLGVILDEVLLDGGGGQKRVATALDGLSLLWVGVFCDPTVAAGREKLRPDRTIGMATSQATQVHDGVRYDLIVDTTASSTVECARTVMARLVSS